MQTVLISVIIPVYNVEKYLDECIDSIVNQTYSNLEIILVDDGSSDSSGEICDAWEKRDTRIQVIHKPNGGQAEARNRGVKTARGEYIVFVDSDDRVHCEYVEYLYNLINCNKADIAICEIQMLMPNKRIINHYADDGKVCLFNQERALYELFSEKCYSCSPCAKIFPRKIFDEILFPEKRIFEDLGTMYKIILKADKIVFGQRALYEYYRRENSTMTSAFKWARTDSIVFAEEMFGAITEVWPNLYGIGCRRLFVEYVNLLRSVELSEIEDKNLETLFNDVFEKTKHVRVQAMNNRLSPKMLCYALSSFFGKQFFRFAIRVEAKLYTRFKLGIK